MRLPALLLMASVTSAGCGASALDRPLTVPLGLDRQGTAAALRRFDYCPGEPTEAALEVFPRCDRPGSEWGDSWVQVEYEGDRLIRVRRWERYDDDERAVERWNQLVALRAKLGPESDPARQALRQLRQLPAGTRSWTAFQHGDANDVAVAVFLLTPTAPENAAILEEIVALPTAR